MDGLRTDANKRELKGSTSHATTNEQMHALVLIIVVRWAFHLFIERRRTNGMGCDDERRKLSDRPLCMWVAVVACDRR